MNSDRLKQLSGQGSQQPTIDQLIAEQKMVNDAYMVAIDALKNHRQLDEGLFTGLRAALGTAAKLTGSGASKAAAAVKKLGSNVKELYLDQKAKTELKDLVKEMRGIVDDFEDAEEQAPTIMKRDTEVNKIMTLFKDLLSKTIDVLVSRQAAAEGVSETLEIKKMLEAEALLEWVENPDFQKLWDAHVPQQGEAKTDAGEAIRAIGRLEYDYYNNGFGNAVEVRYDEDENSYFDDDEDAGGEPEPSSYDPNPYYMGMSETLTSYLHAQKAPAEVVKAARDISPAHAIPWDHRPDPAFAKALKILKNWFVENPPAAEE